MKIKPFGVEQWMNEYEEHCEINLAETCVRSLTVDELLETVGFDGDLMDALGPLKLTYGAIEGSIRLRAAVAALYQHQGPDNVLVTHGAVGANHLVHTTLVEPGDRVVSVLPTYQQHYSIPESLGADVRTLFLRETDDWLPDVEELARLVGDHAKLVVISNPNNPTGSLLDRDYLLRVIEVCERAGAYLLSDEVYRGIDQQGPGATASVADLYDRGISTSSVSKAFSLAGLRLGWVAGPADLVRDLTIHRDYSTISVGMVDDLLATVALEGAERVLSRNRRLVRGNLETLDSWVHGEPGLHWVRPRGGTTALLRYDHDISSRDLCVALLDETGVMLTPGSTLEMEGHLRMGYANDPAVLESGLPRISQYLAKLS